VSSSLTSLASQALLLALISRTRFLGLVGLQLKANSISLILFFDAAHFSK